MNIEIKLIGEIEDAKMQNVLGVLVNGQATAKEAPAEEKAKPAAKVASKPVAKEEAPAEEVEEEEAEEEEAKPVAAKPAPKASPAPKAAAPKPAAKAKPVAEEEDFNELDEDAQLEAIKKEATKHTKKGKTSDIKQLLGLFDVGRASDLYPATYGEFFELVKRYSGGEDLDAIVESFAV